MRIRDVVVIVGSAVHAATRAVVQVLCCAAMWGGAAAADGPLLAPPPDLAERTRGAWIDVYRAWVELADGNAMPVDPGPAFCVGTDGFAVVDQNAVAGSVHLFVTIRGRGPFAARTRAFDPSSALAAIQFHPETLEGVQCLQRPGDDVAPVAVGDVLFALGPAGAGAAPLRVRKVSHDALSFVDGLHATFLAGSPLVDANGLLRGLLVAGTSSGMIGREHATGPLAGLAKRRHATGAVPLAAAFTLIDQVKKQRDDGMPVPPPDPVVRVSQDVFSRTLRKAAGVSAEDLTLYSATTAEATLEFLTPSSLEVQQGLGEYSYAAGKTFFRWPAHAQMWEPMVAVQQSPHFEWTSGSQAAAVFAVIFAIPMVLGGQDPGFRASYTIPKSEAVIAIERGDVRIEPFDSFVDCFEDVIPIEKNPGNYIPRSVRGCRTFYLFRPEAFAPGTDVVVRMTLNQEGKTVAVPVRPETLERITADFAPWKTAVRESAEARTAHAEGVTSAPSPEAVVAPVPPLGVPYATSSGGNAELRITKPAGCSFVVTRLQRDGEPVIRIPVAFVKYGLAPAMVPGFLYFGRDEISFDPISYPPASKYAFTVPRAGLTVSMTIWPRLRIKVGGKHWVFEVTFDVTQKLTLGEAHGSPINEARTGAVELTAKLLGDFDLVLRAFDAAELLEKLSAPWSHNGSTHEEGGPPDSRR